MSTKTQLSKEEVKLDSKNVDDPEVAIAESANLVNSAFECWLVAVEDDKDDCISTLADEMEMAAKYGGMSNVPNTLKYQWLCDWDYSTAVYLFNEGEVEKPVEIVNRLLAIAPDNDTYLTLQQLINAKLMPPLVEQPVYAPQEENATVYLNQPENDNSGYNSYQQNTNQQNSGCIDVRYLLLAVAVFFFVFFVGMCSS